MVVLGAVERRPDQLPVGIAFLIGGLFGWQGIKGIFHMHHLRAWRQTLPQHLGL
jgi:hypothetical protein